ncbi:MAG: MotA/TolQ/ExbB proton channel family protein [Proteobacteria bacterium]|nr:MotA/TolQ/ExbB proton channel family protein [Pseudomonadota bacterium]MBU1716027.1 MotA/TolQ/ExbB proton channel family protein [Pseudomonadota bacterium]
MLELIGRGGVLVWPIMFCSLIGVVIFFERLFCFRKARQWRQSDSKIFGLVRQGKLLEARQLVALKGRGKLNISSAESILYEALSTERANLATMETMLGHAVDREVKYLARHLGALATLGNISPLLGLLGTVVGMIKAFAKVESMGGRVNASVLAGGIWEAMLTTAFGLVVAIPLIIFHSYLAAKLEAIQTDLQEIAVDFLKIWSASGAGDK